MMNASTDAAKQCCAGEHERLMNQLVGCEMDANNPVERLECNRRTAKASGARAKACMAELNR